MLVMLKIECENKLVAKNIEKHIKKMKSRKFIERLINVPVSLQNLISKYQ